MTRVWSLTLKTVNSSCSRIENNFLKLGYVHVNTLFASLFPLTDLPTSKITRRFRVVTYSIVNVIILHNRKNTNAIITQTQKKRITSNEKLNIKTIYFYLVSWFISRDFMDIISVGVDRSIDRSAFKRSVVWLMNCDNFWNWEGSDKYRCVSVYRIL